MSAAFDDQFVAPIDERRIRTAASVNAAFVFIATFLMLLVVEA